MATSPEEIRTQYPIPAYRYYVDIGANQPLAFAEVSGLVIEYNVLSYADGLGWKSAPGMKKGSSITLKKGIVQRENQLFAWINSIQYNTVEKRDITISLINEESTPLISWMLKNAFPIKLEGPKFDATVNAVAIESLTLRVGGISIDYSL